MPAKVLPNQAEFDQFKQKMIRAGFRQICGSEFSKSFIRLGLSNPRKTTGRETGFVFSINGLTVFVWTTFLSAEGCAREEDAGWVLISEGDTPRYFSRPMNRTSGFLDRLLAHAIIAQERIIGRPLCPVCKGFMQIAMGKHLKQRYWRCRRISPVTHIQTLDWDCGLSAESLKSVQSERNARRRYREELKKTGKQVQPAVLKRRPWKVSRPQNRI